MKRYALLIALVLLLTACGGKDQPTPTLVPLLTPDVLPTFPPTETPTEAPPPTTAPTLPLATDTPEPLPTELPPKPALEWIGQIGGTSRAVAVGGGYAYFNVGPRLLVLDVSVRAEPQFVGQSSPLPGFEDLAVSSDGGYAYVTAGEFGLRILDISDPAAPAEIGFYETPAPAWEIETVGNTAYVAADDGLHILNLSNPTVPAQVGFHPTADAARDVAVVGKLAYVAEGYTEDAGTAERGGLHIVDLSDPANPRQVGFYPMNPLDAGELERANAPRGALGVDLLAGSPEGPLYACLLYRTPERGGLRVVDVSDPANPQQVGDYAEVVYSVSDVLVEDQFAFVAAGADQGLLVLNLSDPTQPVLEVNAVPGAARGLALADGTLYVADHFGGLRTARAEYPVSTVEAGFYDALGDARQIVLAGDSVYVADGSRDLWRVDVSDPARLVAFGPFALKGDIQAMAVAGNVVYVAAEAAGLQAVDFSDPTRPVKIGGYATDGLAEGVAVAGEYVYVVDGRLNVLDVADPVSPAAVGVYEGGGSIEQVVVVGSVGYLVDRGLRLVDLTDPAQPVEIGYYAELGEISHLAVWGERVYIVASDGLHVLEVAELAQPVEVGFYPLPGYVSRLEVAQASPADPGQIYAYVSGHGSLYVLDVSDPANMMEILSYPGLQSPNDLAVMGERVYVADGEGGLAILRPGW